MDTPGSASRSLRARAAVLGIAAFGLAVSACGVGGISDLGDSRASVTAEQKQDARTALDSLKTDLQALDVAYTSGDMTEAQSDLDQAKADWGKIIPAATVQDQSDIQVRFDRLSHNLSIRASGKTVSDDVKAFIGELNHDVAASLR